MALLKPSFLTSGLEKHKKRKFCCFEPSSLCDFVPAAGETSNITRMYLIRSLINNFVLINEIQELLWGVLGLCTGVICFPSCSLHVPLQEGVQQLAPTALKCCLILSSERCGQWHLEC